MSKTEEILLSLIQGIVSDPQAVETHSSVQTEDGGKEYILINVKVADGDVGACIGSGGVTAEAVRKVIALIGFKELSKKVYVKIDAPKIPRNHFYNS